MTDRNIEISQYRDTIVSRKRLSRYNTARRRNLSLALALATYSSSRGSVFSNVRARVKILFGERKERERERTRARLALRTGRDLNARHTAHVLIAPSRVVDKCQVAREFLLRGVPTSRFRDCESMTRRKIIMDRRGKERARAQERALWRTRRFDFAVLTSCVIRA